MHTERDRAVAKLQAATDGMGINASLTTGSGTDCALRRPQR